MMDKKTRRGRAGALSSLDLRLDDERVATSVPPEAPASESNAAALPTATDELVAFGFTHPGKQREENEDAFGLFSDRRLFVVADGMGGRAAGEVAARMAVDALEGFFSLQHANPRNPWPFPVDLNVSFGANLLRVGVKVANQAIRQAAAADPSYHRMAATMGALALGETQAVVAHVGDVRVYRLRQGKLVRLMRDHSVLEEMRAARPDMSDEEASSFGHRHVVTRALGSKDEVEPTVSLRSLMSGDVFLLCSDGLWSVLPESRIAEVMLATVDLEAACQHLIDEANEAGGPDNVTAVLVRAP